MKSGSRTSIPRITQLRFEETNGKRLDHCSGREVVLLAAAEERSW